MRKTRPLAGSFALATTLLFVAQGVALGGATGKSDGSKAKQPATDEIYRVEGEVAKPRRLGGPVPEYPELAKEDRIEGLVVARILIEKDGTVSDARIERSLGDAFDALALEAVRQWSFEPASLDGEPVRVHYDITINYRLGDDEKDA